MTVIDIKEIEQNFITEFCEEGLELRVPNWRKRMYWGKSDEPRQRPELESANWYDDWIERQNNLSEDELFQVDSSRDQAEFVFAKLASIDPTPDKRYLEKLCSWYLMDEGRHKTSYLQFNYEKLDQIKERLVRYDQDFGGVTKEMQNMRRAILARGQKMLKPSTPSPIKLTSCAAFCRTMDLYICRQNFLASQDLRRQRDAAFCNKQDAELLFANAEKGLRVYEIKSVAADKAFEVRDSNVQRGMRSPDAVYAPPYIHIELADGSQLRSYKNEEQGGDNVKFGDILVNEQDEEVSFIALLVKYPELIALFKTFMQNRFYKKDRSHFDEDDGEGEAFKLIVDVAAVSVVAKIPDYRNLLTAEIIRGGFDASRYYPRQASYFLQAVAALKKHRNGFAGAVIDLFKDIAKERQIAIARHILSAIAVTPAWREALKKEDITPIFSNLDAGAERFSHFRYNNKIMNPLVHIISYQAFIPQWQNAGEEKYLSIVLDWLANNEDWRRMKPILRAATYNKVWMDQISDEVVHKLNELGDNLLTALNMQKLVDKVNRMKAGRSLRGLGQSAIAKLAA